MGTNHKPVNIAKAALEHAAKNGNNVVIIDTAGRLHIDEAMMDELVEIKENVDVYQTLLVVDAMTGQDAVNVASMFNDKIGIDGVVLTKMDGDTRGGAALSIKAVTGNRFSMSVWARNFPIWNSFTRTVWLPDLGHGRCSFHYRQKICCDRREGKRTFAKRLRRQNLITTTSSIR